MFSSSKTNTNSQKLYLGHKQTFDQQGKDLHYTPAELLHLQRKLQMGKVLCLNEVPPDFSNITKTLLLEGFELLLHRQSRLSARK